MPTMRWTSFVRGENVVVSLVELDLRFLGRVLYEAGADGDEIVEILGVGARCLSSAR
jgi:hypothetical protein